MAKTPVQSATVPKDDKTLKDVASETQSTAAETQGDKILQGEEKDVETLKVDPQVEALIAMNKELTDQLNAMGKVVNAVVKGKAKPAPRKPRPEGNYRLNSAFWDGRHLQPKGKKMSFAEGKAPQSATLLKD